jgi:hypothetical protein
MFKFRPHRASLDEAMLEVREFETQEALREHLAAEFSGTGLNMSDDIVVKPYGHDARIDWDTHIVTIEGFGVVGFTDRMPPEPVSAMTP